MGTRYPALRWPIGHLCTVHSPYYLYQFYTSPHCEKGLPVKFRCEREALAEALSTAGRAATGRTGALPVLSGLRLELSGDQLSITGTDLDLTIQLTLAVGGDGDGGVVLPARLATDIVRSMGAGKVEVIVEGDDVNISGGRSQFSVRPLSLDDYPKLATPSSSSVTLPAAAVGEALRQVVRAASTDEARPILTGVLLTAENGGLRMVATDSYRLAVRDLADHEVLGADQKVLVPGRALNELQRLVGGGDELTMRLGDRDATFEVGGTRLSTRLIEGEFPNYRQVIPTERGQQLLLPTETFTHALRRVALLSAERSRAVKLELSEGQMRLSSNNPDLGDAREELDIDFAGETTSIAFNARYLIDAVSATRSKEIRFGFRDALSPAELSPADDADALAVVMPMRL